MGLRHGTRDGWLTVTVAGHFGEWLQGLFGPEHVVALVTLPCPALAVRSRPDRPADPPFAPDRLAAFGRALDLPPPPWPGLDCAMPPGAGAGASTAMLVALARAGGTQATPDALARACLAVEGASDPLMLEAPDGVLWASRAARVLTRLPPPPPLRIVGGFWGAPAPTDPADTGFPPIDDLVPGWQAACETRDRARCAALASQSAMRCTALRGPADPMAELARATGALGHVRAHTGSARGLVLPPEQEDGPARTALAEAGLTGILSFVTGAA
ncbi:hypothetical protein [Pseudoponticoccus marisrubri]|uniref:Propanediol utilization protein n=1 Tax=Pseudoponticoccus marisrubri TaxID=1685382 RepID=A0A0W7WIF5_9RHOB|nr:hypothetical protein [Pseudoponticoccus marisrubri]KUF10365.1 hypothetical protein AVJ23_13275 [Pseudoponticoccus marisrubri]